VANFRRLRIVDVRKMLHGLLKSLKISRDTPQIRQRAVRSIIPEGLADQKRETVVSLGFCASGFLGDCGIAATACSFIDPHAA
jgi:hypothetical protein